MILDQLYKRTKTGAIQVWYMEIENEKYRTISGQLNGQLVTTEWTVAESKNIGKINETAAEEQARLEVEALYIKKLAQGRYSTTINEIDTSKFFECMLAKNWNDHKKKIKDDDLIFSQPKLDGVRFISTKNGSFSRNGKSIVSVPHIQEVLNELFVLIPDLVIDGELYTDKLSDNFDELISLARQTKPTDEDFEKSKILQYWIYDMYWGDKNASYKDRYEYIVNHIPKDHAILKIVDTTFLQGDDKDQLDLLYGKYMEDGYEGQMIRLDAPYENKRSDKLLKRKEFMSEEFEIIKIEDGKGNRSGIAAHIYYKLPNGEEFKSSIKGSWKYCEELLKMANKYIGGQGTVKFQNYTPNGIPRFPVTVAVFEGKRDI